MVARGRAAGDALPEDDLEHQLHQIVRDLPAERRRDAEQAISEACRKLRAGDNPLGGLRPPPDCPPCKGIRGGTHHFLCLSRVRQPSAVESRLRDKVKVKLNVTYSEMINVAPVDEVETHGIEPRSAHAIARNPIASRPPRRSFRSNTYSAPSFCSRFLCYVGK